MSEPDKARFILLAASNEPILPKKDHGLRLRPQEPDAFLFDETYTEEDPRNPYGLIIHRFPTHMLHVWNI